MRFEEAVEVSCPHCGSEEIGGGEVLRNEWYFGIPEEGWVRRLLPKGVVEDTCKIEDKYFFCTSCGEHFHPRNLGEEQLLDDLLAEGLLERYTGPADPALCGSCAKFSSCRKRTLEGMRWECDDYVRRERRDADSGRTSS